MKSVYEECPVIENEFYNLRLVSLEDAEDLFQVYGDKDCVPYFNGDNCNGDDFYYCTKERVEEAIRFWLQQYEWKGFVRWSIIDKKKKQVIGTIELFHRDLKDYFHDCGLLRLDVRRDYEKADILKEIISLIMKSAYELFECSIVATKAPTYAKERRKALEELGFLPTKEKLVGHDGTEYGDYWTLHQV